MCLCACIYTDTYVSMQTYICLCLSNKLTAMSLSRSKLIRISTIFLSTSLVVQWSEYLTTNHEVPGSIPGSTVGIFLGGEDSRSEHGLGRLVEFRFKAPPGTTSSSITTHTLSGQRNCASRASQPQKSVTLLPFPGGRATKSTKRTCGGIGKYIYIYFFRFLL